MSKPETLISMMARWRVRGEGHIAAAAHSVSEVSRTVWLLEGSHLNACADDLQALYARLDALANYWLLLAEVADPFWASEHRKRADALRQIIGSAE